MHPDPAGRDRSPLQDTKDLLAIFAFLVHAAAVLHELLFRVPGSCGRRYFGVQALVGVCFALPAFLLLCGPPAASDPYLVTLWSAQFHLLILHRLAALFRRRHVHSHYIGDSILGRLLPRLREDTAKALEMPVAIAVGALVFQCLSPAYGLFLIAGGLVVNPLHLALIAARDRRRLELAQDQRIEAHAFTERFRDLDR